MELRQLVELVKDELEARGEPLVLQQGGDDVELIGERDGVPLRVLFLGPSFQQFAGPLFMRIEYGRPELETRLWAVISGVELENDPYAENRELPTFQAAAGLGRLVLGVGFWISRESLQTSLKIARAALALFEHLRVELERHGPEAWNMLSPGVSPFSPDAPVHFAKQSKSGLMLGNGLIGGSILGTVAGFLVDPITGFALATQLAPIGVVGGAIALGVYFKKQVAPRTSGVLARKLKAFSIFDEYDPVKAVEPMRPVVLLNEPSGRALGAPVFQAATFGARSTKFDISLKMSVQTLSTLKRVVPESLVVPPSWAALELNASPDILGRLPGGDEEEREKGSVRWLFSHRELEQGALEQLLSQVEVATDAVKSGPYR